MKSATLGNGPEMSSTLKGLNVCVDAAGAGDATPPAPMPFIGVGVGNYFWWMTQGSPALRANPGLMDGIPLGFLMLGFDGQ
jgi:hypothetical protein